MTNKELKVAAFAVWIILSGMILLILILPFLLPPDAIGKIAPECEWKAKYGKECPLCGMTRSFLYISRGDFARARLTHGFGLYLYAFFVLNETGIALVLIKRSMKIQRRQKI